MARGIHLVVRREFWTLGKRGVKNRRVGTGNEQSCRIAMIVALNFSPWRIGCVAGVTTGAQRRLVQQSAAIQVQDEHWSIGCGGIDFFQGRHPALRKLKLTPATDYANPLTGRCALCLLPQHSQPIRERRNAVPAEFHVEIEAATNDMKVRVVQPGNDTATVEVN